MAKNIKSVIAVGSGKGGVGKSTVAVNLALALKQQGFKVGLLDADIYGPSIPIMLGIREGEKPTVVGGNRIAPLVRYEMPVMSMGFLLGQKEAVIWRGPMLGKMLQQFLEQVEWGDLDYLIVDLPPGTGDVQLSLAQLIPLSGAVVVGTPQDVALADVVRAVSMFEMTKVPVLGIIENMSCFVAPDTRKKYYIFGGGEDKKRYEKMGLRFLGEIPLELETRESGDAGIPIVVKSPGSEQAKRFSGIAKNLVEILQSSAVQEDLELPSLH